MDQKKIVKWGIIGTAWIANERVIPAINAAENAEVVAIAGRNEQKVKRFAETHAIKRQYISYDELLKDPEIDAVYIPLPNHMHAEWTIRAAEKGKHVLCEKPAALNVNDIERMVATCRKQGVLFMEAFAFLVHPWWYQLKEAVIPNRIGQVKTVQVNYSILVHNSSDIRLNPSMGGGALYDIGSYCVNGINFIMDDEPQEVLALAKWSKDKTVDQALTVILKFPGEKLAQFTCSFEGEYNQVMEITGEKGVLRIRRPFHHPEMEIIQNGQKQIMNFEDQLNVYTNQIQHFSTCILTAQRPLYGYDKSIANMKVIEQIYTYIKSEK